jgi:hypothetical protein
VQKTSRVNDQPDRTRLRSDLYRIGQAGLIRQFHWNRTLTTEAVDSLKLACILKGREKGRPYATRCAKDNRDTA